MVRAETCPIIQFNNSCSCTSTNNKGIGINCSGGQPFEQILYALQPLMEKPSIKIEVLRIQNTPIPQMQLNSLTSLLVRHLILFNNTLSQFQVSTSSDSSLFNTVEQLELQNNEITNIEDCPSLALFSNLHSLSLAGNKLNQILPKTFFNFNSRKKLLQLDLSENFLSDISINSKAFIGLEFLQKLSLEKNNLNYFPTEAIANLSDSLEELFLSANQINSLEPGDIPSLPRLKSLGLDVNQINYLDSNTFNSIPSLWYLYLSQNQFSSIPSIFDSIPELKVLSMGGNPIERIEANSFLSAKSLLRLDLSQCKINYLNNNCFSPISRLQFVNLRGNRLKYISNKLFEKENKLSFLVSIDLAQNQIEKVEDFAFTNLNQLQSIDLSYNRLQTFDSNTFRGTFLQTQNAAVQILDLTENQIDCNPDKIEWLLSLNGRVRIQGSCSRINREQNIEIIDLAKIVSLAVENEILKKTTKTPTTFNNKINISGSENEKRKNRKINKNYLRPLNKIKNEKNNISKIENEELFKNNFILLLNNETKNNNNTKSEENDQINALIEEEDELQPNNNENGWFVLKLVVIIAVIGFLLTTFILATRGILPFNWKLLGECFINHRKRKNKGNNRQRMKFFFPCKKNSYSPSNIPSFSSTSSHFPDNQQQFNNLNYYLNNGGLKRITTVTDLNEEKLKNEEINLKRVKRELFFF